MKFRQVQSLAELLSEVRAEAASLTRYPARFIVVSGLAAWRQVIEAMSKECDYIVRLSRLCEGDSFPLLSDVLSELAAHASQQTLVLPLGEVLRLLPQTGRDCIRWLTHFEHLGRGRLYIPLLDSFGAARAEIELSPHYRDQIDGAWEIRDDGEVELVVGPYACNAFGGSVLPNVHDYLRCWEDGGIDQGYFVTEHAPHLAQSTGMFTVRVARQAFDLVSLALVDGHLLQPEWGTQGEWRWLSERLLPGDTVCGSAARLLNARSFAAEPAFAWTSLTPQERWLYWIWGRLSSITGRVGRLLKQSASPGQMVTLLLKAGFSDDVDLAFLRERRELLRLAGLTSMPEWFWERWRMCGNPLARLKALVGLSDDDLVEIVRTTAELVRAKVDDGVWLEVIQINYPDLAAYLTPCPGLVPELATYLSAYTRSRVCDEPSEELESLSMQWVTRRALWTYQTRATVLEGLAVDVDAVLWCDALGIEWSGLFYSVLSAEGLRVSLTATRANLPTVTDSNADWPADAEVERALDRIAHRYDYSYPFALIEEIAAVSACTRRLKERCLRYGWAALASDHGLTRFAARGGRVHPPEGYIVHHWGRHATPSSECTASPPDSDIWYVDGRSIVLGTHHLFENGTRAVGQVHGGAAPEECLVPVIRVYKQDNPLPRIVSAQAIVSLSVRGEGELKVELDRAVGRLHILVGLTQFEGLSADAMKWSVRIVSIRPGRYRATVYADQNTIGDIELEVIQGLQQRDLGL